MLKVSGFFVLAAFVSSCASAPKVETVSQNYISRAPAADPMLFHFGKIQCKFDKDDPFSNYQADSISAKLLKDGDTLQLIVNVSSTLVPLRWHFPITQLREQAGHIAFFTVPGRVDDGGFTTFEILSVDANSVKLETISNHKKDPLKSIHLLRSCEIQGDSIDMEALSKWIHGD